MSCLKVRKQVQSENVQLPKGAYLEKGWSLDMNPGSLSIEFMFLFLAPQHYTADLLIMQIVSLSWQCMLSSLFLEYVYHYRNFRGQQKIRAYFWSSGFPDLKQV